MKAASLLTHSLRQERIANVMASALEAVEPGRLVRRYLAEHPLPPHNRLFLLGFGKAAEAMTLAAADSVGPFTGGLIVTKQLSEQRDSLRQTDTGIQVSAESPQLRMMEAGHPLPDGRSVAAGERILDIISGLERGDLLVCLISGGASSLVVAPPIGVSLLDLRTMTSALLASGVKIDDVNTLRRHLDRLKGGGMAASTSATILSLILSDVVGDRPEVIASGPTVADATTNRDALAILERHRIPAPGPVLRALQTPEQIYPHPTLGRVHNVIIGSNRTAVEAAIDEAKLQGFDANIAQTDLQGEAAEVGRRLGEMLLAAKAGTSGPFCLVCGGETTVTLDRPGKGGRNQELALASVDVLDGVADILLLSLATDGNDGPTDAAGAVVTGETQQRAFRMGLRADEYLANHDAYSFFEALGDLLRPGYTGTNVNDLILLFGL